MPIVVRRLAVPCFSLWLTALGPSLACAQEQTPPPALPSNIDVSPLLHETVLKLLRTSPTFARQCARIADARFARVVIVAWVPQNQYGPRARSVITRHRYGALRAMVEVPVSIDHAELIGHEIEHVIEQIEGLDLPAMAREGHKDVAEVYDGVYETRRARAAGLAVAGETVGDPEASRRVGALLRAIRARVTRQPVSRPLPVRR